MSLLSDAYATLLSGLTHKVDNKIHWYDKMNNPIVIKPINISSDMYVVQYIVNGNKLREVEYKGDMLHGKEMRWDTNNNKRWKAMWKDGLLHGDCIEWYENGQKSYYSKFNDGKLNGKKIRWHENGIKESECLYIDDKIVGSCIRWDENGNKIIEEKYEDGHPTTYDYLFKNVDL